VEENKSDQYLIERYLLGQLTGHELGVFNTRLVDDLRFKQHVEFQSLLYKGILQAYNRDQYSKINSLIKYKRALIPTGLKWILVFLAVMVSVSSLWFYLTPDTGSRENGFFSLPDFKRGISTKKSGGKNKKENMHDLVLKADTGIVFVADSLTASNEVELNTLDTLSIVSETFAANDLEVKKDQLLIAIPFQVNTIYTGSNDKQQTGLTASVSDKLNPAAGLPDNEQVKSSVDVEFWVSPVNYKGYRFGETKLILFGVDEPDQVSLFKQDGNFYLSIQSSVYLLEKSEDFLPYVKLRDSEIPLALKNRK
jgi:hypothetical protein